MEQLLGNGISCSETIKEMDNPISYTIVNEAGASIYSASDLGIEEFPDLDVTVRGVISIARRLQDPLGRVGQDRTKHIGVGQYQHDLNQGRLSEALTGVVEDSVNRVGVDLNTASPSLLKYVSGISAKVAKNIVATREEGQVQEQKGAIGNKGPRTKTFEQCAAFENP